MRQGLAQEQIAQRGWAYSAEQAKALIGGHDVALIDLRENCERHLSDHDLRENLSLEWHSTYARSSS